MLLYRHEGHLSGAGVLVFMYQSMENQLNHYRLKPVGSFDG